jgi:hypothetical protein
MGVLELERGRAARGKVKETGRESVNAKMERTASNKYEEKYCEREKGKRSGKREKNDAN